MNPNNIKEAAGKAAASTAKNKIGMYWLGIFISPEILTHQSRGNQSGEQFGLAGR
jgi:hypothetical protein